MKKWFYILAVCLLLCSCGRKTIYSEFKHLPIQGWNADSILDYEFSIDNTEKPYDIILVVRHNQTYPYQNLWFFVKSQLYNDTSAIHCDTIQYLLADERGRWLGNGFGMTREYVALFDDNVLFPDTGRYKISIQQAMREEILSGIEDVGVIIEEKKTMVED